MRLDELRINAWQVDLANLCPQPVEPAHVNSNYLALEQDVDSRERAGYLSEIYKPNPWRRATWPD